MKDRAGFGQQMRCQTIINAQTYGGDGTTAQCWFYNGHVGPHWFGGEDYADTVSRSLTGLPFDEAKAVPR